MIEAVINVRDTCGTYVARVSGWNITASCTMGAEPAAEAVARKLAKRVGAKDYTIERVGQADTWMFRTKE